MPSVFLAGSIEHRHGIEQSNASSDHDQKAAVDTVVCLSRIQNFGRSHTLDQRVSFCGALALFVVFASAIAQASSGEFKVTIERASTKVCVGDPLLLRVLLTNETENEIKLPRKIASSLGTLRFEIRKPGDDIFRHVNTRTPPGKMGPPLWDEFLPPGETVVSCEALYKAGPLNYAFAEPGTYLIRVNVGIATTTLVTSSDVEVKVSKRPVSESEPLARASSLLINQLDPIHGPVGNDHKEYDRLAAELSESQVRATLLWKSAVARVSDAREPDEAAAARKEFEALRKRSDPVSRDWMTLGLAAAFYRSKNYEAAIAVLDDIKDGNTQKAQLIREISEIQRERLENKIRREKEGAVPKPPAEKAAPNADN